MKALSKTQSIKIIAVLLCFSGIILSFSYDINLTGLTSNNTLGALEFNLRMNFGNPKRRECGAIGKFELHNRSKCPVRF